MATARKNTKKEDKRYHPRRVRRLAPNALGQEQQHFLLTAGAVTMSEAQIARLSEAEAYETFKTIRFAENGGEPMCPHEGCGHTKVYPLFTARRIRAAKGGFVEPIYKCAACRRQFTATSGRLFNSRKMLFRDILYSLMVFVNAVSGEAALRLRRAVGCSYKSAFVFEGKVRVAIGQSREDRQLGGDRTVESDGKVVGGHQRPKSMKKGQAYFYGDKRRHLVGVRERGAGGESRITVVEGHELNAMKFLEDTIMAGSRIVTDGIWSLGHIGPHETVIHSEGFSIDGVDTNQIESLWARLQRAEEGVYYRIIGKNLDLYAQEISWREDYRRVANGELWGRLVGIVTAQPVSRRWKGYWQRWQQEGIKRRNRPSKLAVAPTK